MGEGGSLGSRLGETAEKGERVFYQVKTTFPFIFPLSFFLLPFFFYFSPCVEIGESARFASEAATS